MLVGATTENPYFEVNSALLSRCRVYELHALETEHVLALLRRSLGDERGITDAPRVDDAALEFLATRSGGDAAHGAVRARAGLRHRGRGRRGHAARGRGRPPAQRDPLRQGGRPPLRPDLGLDQVHARLRPGRLADVPRRDDRGRRGPALHRAAHDHPGERGHRERRSARARAGGGHRCGRGARGHARVRAEPRPGRGLPGAGAEVERLATRPSAGPASGCASTAPRTRRTTCGAPPTRARRSSAAARGTTLPTTARRACPTRS